MAGRFKILPSAVVLLLVVWCVFGSGHSRSPAYDIPRQALDGGGAMWLSTTSYKLCSSLSQSITGVQEGASYKLYTGYWNPWVVEASPVEWEESDFSQRPTDFALRQNYPNPFNPITVIQYSLPKSSFVKIEIYNILGQKVRTLLEEPQELGYKTIQWDGEDDSGVEVSSGVYFYKIEAGTFVECKKMTLLK
jgi:hypothetical protein